MISIRPAQEDDLPSIHAIYTHYVLNTALTFLTHEPPLSYTADKYHDLKTRGLPFLVAVEEGEGGEDKGTICGYASASPFRGYMFGYAPTVELTLFLLPTHKSRGVGGRLLRAVTSALQETVHVPCEFEGVTGHEVRLENGSKVRNLIAVMAVDERERDGGEWLRGWYVSKGFEEVGRIKKAGFKMERW